MTNGRWEPPVIDYRPADPQRLDLAIGLIGCGNITRDHLAAYRQAGYRVTALCDIDRAAAERRRDEFFPAAAVDKRYPDLLARADVNVVDIATHAEIRAEIIEAALLAGKHVLSQKPFVLDLEVGRRLVSMADRGGLKLAVNQNARWAPHFSYLRQAVLCGLIGKIQAVHCGVHWDHNWVAGTTFDDMRHVILFDFAIHWFDIMQCLMKGELPQSVLATTVRSPTQTARQALLAQALVQYQHAQGSLVFDGNTRHGRRDTTVVVGEHGTLYSSGPDGNRQQVTLCRGDYELQPQLEGHWFPDGFHGTMGELLRAIEEDRSPSNSAAANLDSLAVCFAAVASADRGGPVVPGDVRAVPE